MAGVIRTTPLRPSSREAGGDSHMKVTGMLVVWLRDVNCRFWSHSGCSGQKANVFTHTGVA